MSIQAITIGDKLKKVRSEMKLNQTEMAEKLSIKRSRLGSYEEGRASPDILTFLEICKICKKDPFWFSKPET